MDKGGESVGCCVSRGFVGLRVIEGNDLAGAFAFWIESSLHRLLNKHVDVIVENNSVVFLLGPDGCTRQSK